MTKDIVTGGINCKCLQLKCRWPCLSFNKNFVPAQLYILVLMCLQPVPTSVDMFKTFWDISLVETTPVMFSTMPDTQCIFQGNCSLFIYFNFNYIKPQFRNKIKTCSFTHTPAIL